MPVWITSLLRELVPVPMASVASSTTTPRPACASADDDTIDSFHEFFASVLGEIRPKRTSSLITTVVALAGLLSDKCRLHHAGTRRPTKAFDRRHFFPAALPTGMTQAPIAAPCICTVPAPYCASPQPNFGPFSPRSLCSADSMVCREQDRCCGRVH
jgi:hypothetical protein